MQTYLSAQHVRKTYGKEIALKGATLELHGGEILALLGPNGAGKTTFIKILATLLTKDAGSVDVMGYDLDRHENEVRYLFGYVGQDTDRSAYGRLSVRENLRFFGALRGLERRTIDARIDTLAGYFDFGAHLDKLFMHLSGGQKQTVVIMRAFLHDPPLIYLDEPTKGLDPLVGKRIRTFLKDYVQREGKALLLTSHILSEVDELANRVALIQGGEIPIVGTPGDLKRTVGASDFIDLYTERLPPATQDRLRHLDTVLTVIDGEPGWTSFGVSDYFDGTESIIRVLREEGVRTEYRHHAVSLEDAFIHQLGVLNERFER
jgi:ABC-type multidrug transport system ATPase subunit